MESCVSLPGWLKRCTALGLAGAGVILFAAPLLTVVVTVGTCVLVGFLLWLPLHTVFFGPQSAWRQTWDGSTRWRRRLTSPCAALRGRCRAARAGVENAVERWWPPVSGGFREGVSGAVLGVLMVLLSGLEGPAAAAALLSAGLAGVAIGVSNQFASVADQGASRSMDQLPSS